VLSLIGNLRHKELFFRGPFSDRKRITKTPYCKDTSYKRLKGEGGRLAGQELRYPSPNFPIVHDTGSLGTYPAWFLQSSSVFHFTVFSFQ
jgi:hypothetical protein